MANKIAQFFNFLQHEQGMQTKYPDLSLLRGQASLTQAYFTKLRTVGNLTAQTIKNDINCVKGFLEWITVDMDMHTADKKLYKQIKTILEQVGIMVKIN